MTDTRLLQRRAIRWMRPLAPLVLVVVAVAALTTQPAPAGSGRGLVVAIALAVVVPAGGGAVLTTERSVALHVSLIVALLAGSGALAWVQPHGAGIAGIFVGLSLLAPVFRRHRLIPAIIVGAVVLAVAIATARQGAPIPALLDGIMIVAFFGMLLLAIRLAEANRRTEQLVSELAASRDAAAQAASLAERQRLAREMHDVLAHSLSGLILQLEGARMLAAEDPGDPRLPAVVERAHQLGRTGLEEARRAIGTLRDDELPGPERLAELAAQFERDRGVPCAVTVDGTPRALGSEAGLAVYRVAQEALTNVGKHATTPERVTMSLRYESGSARLVVEDFGDPPVSQDRGRSATDQDSEVSAGGRGGGASAAGQGGGGYGLTGMRERAELLGGRLTAGPTGQGFRVELEVPA